MFERRFLRAGWLVVAVELGFRFIDPAGRIYQLLDSKLTEPEIDSLRELIGAGAAHFDVGQSDASFAVVASCTLPELAGPAGAVPAHEGRKGHVYWLGASTPAPVAKGPEDPAILTPDELGSAPAGAAVLIARGDHLTDPDWVEALNAWLSRESRSIVPFGSVGDVASVGPVLAPLQGTACPDCLRDRLQAERLSKIGLSLQQIGSWRAVPDAERSLSYILATQCARDIAGSVANGMLTSAGWYRNARLIDTLTWETSERVAVRVPDCDRCAAILRLADEVRFGN